MSIFELLNDSLALNASDLHLSSGLVPMVRVDGEVQGLDYPALTPEILSDLLESFMTDQQNADFAEHLETDFSYAYKDIARFRVNVFQQNRGPGAVLRTNPTTVLSMDQIGNGPNFSRYRFTASRASVSDRPHGFGKVHHTSGTD